MFHGLCGSNLLFYSSTSLGPDIRLAFFALSVEGLRGHFTLSAMQKKGGESLTNVAFTPRAQQLIAIANSCLHAR